MGIDAFPMGLLYIKSGEPMDSNISPMAINACPMGLFYMDFGEPLDGDMVPWA